MVQAKKKNLLSLRPALVPHPESLSAHKSAGPRSDPRSSRCFFMFHPTYMTYLLVIIRLGLAANSLENLSLESIVLLELLQEVHGLTGVCECLYAYVKLFFFAGVNGRHVYGDAIYGSD